MGTTTLTAAQIIAQPANTNHGYAVQINASVLADWGSPVSYQTAATRPAVFYRLVFP